VLVAIVHCEDGLPSHPVPVFSKKYVLLVSEYIQSVRPSPLISISCELVGVGADVGNDWAGPKTVVVAAFHAEPLPRYEPFVTPVPKAPMLVRNPEDRRRSHHLKFHW